MDIIGFLCSKARTNSIQGDASHVTHNTEAVKGADRVDQQLKQLHFLNLQVDYQNAIKGQDSLTNEGKRPQSLLQIVVTVVLYSSLPFKLLVYIFKKGL